MKFKLTSVITTEVASSIILVAIMLMIQQIFDFLYISRCTYDFTDVSSKFIHMLNIKVSLLFILLRQNKAQYIKYNIRR